MEKEFISLWELQTKLKRGIEGLFSDRLWVKAEISAIKARPGGHCYMELSQSDDSGLVAKVSAIIWSSKYKIIEPYFRSVTGSTLQEGMAVLFYVQVNFSPVYGLSLVVDDVDPEYLLGEQEVKRQQAIEKLRAEGLLDMQKELAFPTLPYHLAVISAPDAAGYRDFVRHIEENPYGFTFDIELYPAVMQGFDCPESVIGALNDIEESGKSYDLVLLLRGGGGKLDLACFDDYHMAAAISRFATPVVTAIGHDQDYHICDMVANTYVKTPTALADMLVSLYEDADSMLSSILARLKLAVMNRVSNMEMRVDALESRLRAGAIFRLANEENRLQLYLTRIMATDPSEVLRRGYALVADGEGRAIKKAGGQKAGSEISVVFSDGELKCRIVNVKNN